MRGLYLEPALFLLAACASGAEAPAPPVAKPDRVAFVSQCRFDNGVRAVLSYRFRAEEYRLILRHRDGRSDVSTLRPREDGRIELDTNGGLGKSEGIENVFSWLLRKPFRLVALEEFPGELRRAKVERCPGRYPFSP